MKSKFLLIVIFFVVTENFSQTAQKVLFTIDTDTIYSDEFMAVYKKNQHLISNSEENDIENYFQLFVDYKLKVKEAKEFGFDTLQKFKNELKQYKENLISPYLKDEKVTLKLVNEAYLRLQKEVNASHILIFVKPEASSKDTLEAYNTLLEARDSILSGKEFSTVAKKYSKDPSVDKNGGEIGYFTALQMVYPFEEVAFNTSIGEVSMPFRTKFGFHILKVNDIRESKGEIEVAHIMLKKNSVNADKKIDSIYSLLEKNKDNFEELAKELSEDRASAPSGGVLKRFSAGQMIEEFSNVSFSLEEVGEISKPFQTIYGWHIIKLIEKYPLESFESIEDKLTRQVESDDRSDLIGKSVIDKLFKEYNIVVNNDALNQFNVEDWKTNPEKFHQELIQIEGKVIYQENFISFLKSVKNVSILNDFESFKEKEVLNYYKDNIEVLNEEFAATYKEFKEGMLLFEMLEKQVWEKSKDSTGLANYYESNKVEKYNNRDLESFKGTVISDYQNYLEKKWVADLHMKYNVQINKKEKKHILKAKLN
jgi:peptidyl-prolyl cis-trans isomerase SurA